MNINNDIKPIYYKITNKNENHNGFQYQDGLNILIEPFRKTRSCVPGGLYFTTIEYIHQFYHLGVNIRVVELPDEDPDFLMVKDPDGDKWRANKIILGKKYSLLDPLTYTELGLDITKNDQLMNLASQYGRIDVLEWWKNSGLKRKYSYRAMNLASKYGHVNVLEWWKVSGLKLKYQYDAMNWASENNQVDVLEWWKRSGLKLVYDNRAMDSASAIGHVNVLEWWKRSDLELKYTSKAIYMASGNGHVDVLEWWKRSGLKLKYSEWAFPNGHINVLEWLEKSGLNLKNSQ